MIDCINGMPVYVSPMATQPRKWTLPVFKLRPWLIVSDGFRAEFDNWLTGIFGTRAETVTHGIEPAVYVMDAALLGLGAEKRLIVHPEIWAQIKKVNEPQPK
jgi:hypothetical protein